MVEETLLKQFKPRLPFLVLERTIKALAGLYGNSVLSTKLANSDAKRLLVGLITVAANEVQYELIKALLTLCKSECSLWCALLGREGVQQLISHLGLSSEQQQECAIALLCLLSDENVESKWAITAAVGIPPLVQILESGSAKAKEDSAAILRNWVCCPLKDAEGINNRLEVVDHLITLPEVVFHIAQHLCKLPDLELLLGWTKSSLKVSSSILLPLLAKKILKKRVKVFGSLVKGLQTTLSLLLLLQKEKSLISSLTKIVKLPVLTGSDGLDQFLTQFEAAVDSDFPNYQNHDVTDTDAETLTILAELFLEKAAQWVEVVHAINYIDVLRSFAVTSSFSCGTVSRPVVVPTSKGTSKDSGVPELKMKGLWHPFALGESGRVPVPNNIILGENEDMQHPRTLLLTGPNMGGKSTLLRATCLAVIMAQLGCYVPCENCVLSVVDIIFTRLGATDRIMAGDTFFIEYTETASVLRNATQDSLVILDELGRGTSTFDGYDIAYAVFRHLIGKVNCRLLFAAHYHPLTKEFASHPQAIKSLQKRDVLLQVNNTTQNQFT